MFFQMDVAFRTAMTKIMKIQCGHPEWQPWRQQEGQSTAPGSAHPASFRAIPDFLKPSNHDKKPVIFFRRHCPNAAPQQQGTGQQ